jgi:hypothetical protein
VSDDLQPAAHAGFERVNILLANTESWVASGVGPPERSTSLLSAAPPLPITSNAGEKKVRRARATLKKSD